MKGFLKFILANGGGELFVREEQLSCFFEVPNHDPKVSTLVIDGEKVLVKETIEDVQKIITGNGGGWS